VKKFDPDKKISELHWAAIERAAVLAPSSYGLQPYKLLVVSDAGVRTQLRAAAWNQSQVTDASHLVVFCRKREVTPADVEAYMQRIVQVRGTDRGELKGLEGMILGSIANPASLPGGSMDTYTRSQTYIALGFMLFAAAQLGVDACPMEGFDPVKFDEILRLAPTGYTSTVLAAVGYRAGDDWLAKLAKVRKPEGEFITRV
jgi:nitroreductase